MVGPRAAWPNHPGPQAISLGFFAGFLSSLSKCMPMPIILGRVVTYPVHSIVQYSTVLCRHALERTGAGADVNIYRTHIVHQYTCPPQLPTHCPIFAQSIHCTTVCSLHNLPPPPHHLIPSVTPTLPTISLTNHPLAQTNHTLHSSYPSETLKLKPDENLGGSKVLSIYITFDPC